ncbi:hypothetical protein LTSEMIN_5483, partial [Salmonella enterica subsp. enterica serovar Minnesota str. A4-603]
MQDKVTFMGIARNHTMLMQGIYRLFDFPSHLVRNFW